MTRYITQQVECYEIKIFAVVRDYDFVDTVDTTIMMISITVDTTIMMISSTGRYDDNDDFHYGRYGDNDFTGILSRCPWRR